MASFDKRFRTNSTADRLARLSVPKSRKYMKLREEGKTLEEALDIVAPISAKTELVLNTNFNADDEAPK
jgi:hypothetical protein